MSSAFHPVVTGEFRATVSARGIAPTPATVEHLSTSKCVLIAQAYFDRGDTVEFELDEGSPGRPTYVRGTVATRVAMRSQFVYELHLDRMSAREMDALASHLSAIANLPTTDAIPAKGAKDETAAIDMRGGKVSLLRSY